MTKAEIIRLLEPFTDETELRIWNCQGWVLFTGNPRYSKRSGKTTIYLEPNKPKVIEAEEKR